MHHLNNIRFKFNDSGFLILTYPEVDFSFTSQTIDKKAPKLFNYEKKIAKKELFDNLFQQILWVSYRRSFYPLHFRSGTIQDSRKPLVSDCGWGCMIRCAQMLVTNTLQKLTDEKFLQMNTNLIIRKVLDLQDEALSLHSIIKQG